MSWQESDGRLGSIDRFGQEHHVGGRQSARVDAFAEEQDASDHQASDNDPDDPPARKVSHPRKHDRVTLL